MFNVVLVEPEIPNNTGNVGRTCVALSSHLHLVEPFGFELNDKQLKRAGLDYWVNLNWTTYQGISRFKEIHTNKRKIYFSAHGKKTYFEHQFKEGDFLIFGKESKGLDPEILIQNQENTYCIPTPGQVRSLNLATAVAIVMYEGYLQLTQNKK